MRQRVLSGISPRFRGLSQSRGQVTHVLLTRSPLEHPRRGLSARLACVKHAASVRPEPASNSPTKNNPGKTNKHPARTTTRSRHLTIKTLSRYQQTNTHPKPTTKADPGRQTTTLSNPTPPRQPKFPGIRCGGLSYQDTPPRRPLHAAPGATPGTGRGAAPTRAPGRPRPEPARCSRTPHPPRPCAAPASG